MKRIKAVESQGVQGAKWAMSNFSSLVNTRQNLVISKSSLMIGKSSMNKKI